jgi:hypothetical protein
VDINAHASNMGGAYIASFTAFLVVNFEMKQAWVLWLAPGIILGFLLNYQTKSYLQKSKKSIQ